MSLNSIEEVTHGVTGYEPLQETTRNQQSISFSFSLQILTREGLSVKGDATVNKTSTIPQRASASVQISPVDDVEQEYDDNSVGTMPRSALRFRSTQPQPTRTTGPIQAPVVSHRVSGSTRALLWVLLGLCLLFVGNGVIMPLVNDALTQLKYGDSRIATYDLAGKHWITEESNGRVRLIDSNPDGSHSQQLVMNIANAPKHALVTLKENGTHVDVSINDAYVTYLVADGNSGYKWGPN